jgi:hypothetical protein
MAQRYRFSRWTVLGLLLLIPALAFGRPFIRLTDDPGVRLFLIMILIVAMAAALAFIFRIGQQPNQGVRSIVRPDPTTSDSPERSDSRGRS